MFQGNALEPQNNIDQFGHTAWTRQSGQIPGAVFALTQTSDGNLWVGTEFGLLHFDGARFLEWQPPAGGQLSGTYITALAPARDGSLWIGTRNGLCHVKGSHFETYPTSRGAGGPGIAAILEDPHGVVWVGTVGYRSGGLCQVRARSLDCHGMDTWGLAGPGVHALFEGSSGDLWLGGMGGVAHWTAGLARAYRGSFSAAQSVAEDDNGRIWLATSSGLMRLAGQTIEPCNEVKRSIHPTVLLRDRDGALWIGTQGQGLLHIYQGRVDQFTHTDGLSHDDVRCLLEDREGSIWVGTAGGLDRFRHMAVTTLSKREKLAADIVTSVSQSHSGGIWIGTARGLNHLEHGNVRLFDRRDGLPSNAVTAMFEDQSGRLWIDSDRGLASFDGRTFNTPFAEAVNMRAIAAVAQDRNGAIWFSDGALGMVRVEDSRVAQIVPWSVFRGKQAWAMEPDFRTGGLWLGFAQGGLAHYKSPQSVSWYDESEGLPGGLVSDLHMTKDHTLWVATESGLSQLRGHTINTFDTRNGLPCNRIHAIVEDDSGALWLNTACGLARISRSDLDAWSRNPRSKIAVKVYDSQDGMPTRATPSGYFRRAARSNDGRLWFAAVSALAMVDPHHIRENRLAPPVEIEQITADRQTYQLNSPLKLPPLTRDVEIDYAALSFVDPGKVRFRYRLDGFDREWKDVGIRRQAVYTNLPPGTYQFRVIAANNDGVWNTRGAAARFAIEPALYQTEWFKAFCVAAVFVLVWSGYRFRMRQLEQQLNLKYQARLAERTRIARDLHDTLLQNVSGFALQLDGLSKIPSIPQAARDVLRNLRIEAEHWLREVRESVWELRPKVSGKVDLRKALENAAQQVILSEPVKFRITTSGVAQSISAHVEEQLVRIFQEALRNAIRHGHATQITVRANYQRRRWIHLLIRDDGSGFDAARAEKIGHYGLATMRERAEQIGGELTIRSTPGRGAEIEIRAPIRNSKAHYLRKT